ncbi:MAG: hypothetical protein KJP14_09000, partial [Eudoraea sp.]|nr:hypothetical protein [Eudoraea sp.]
MHNLTSKLSTIFLLLLLALVSCGKSDRKSELAVNEHGNDSILIWIKEGRNNTELGEEGRRKLLEKALKAINETTPDSLKLKYYSQLSPAYLNLND